MQDGRNTDRSQKINDNSFCEEPSSSERTVRPVATLDTDDVKKTALEYVLLMKAIRSTLKMKYFVKEWENPLLIMTRVMNQ